MLTIDFTRCDEVREQLQMSSAGLISSRDYSEQVSKFDYLLHEIGHALSLGIPVHRTDCYDVSFRIKCTLDERSERFCRHNEAVVLGSDLIVYECLGLDVPKDQTRNALANSDLSERTFRRVLARGESIDLARRVVAWLHRHRIVTGRAPRIARMHRTVCERWRAHAGA